MKGFDPEILVGLSAGTGFAGMFGACYYLIMKWLEIGYIYYLGFLIFLFIIYLLSFKRLEHLKTKYEIL